MASAIVLVIYNVTITPQGNQSWKIEIDRIVGNRAKTYLATRIFDNPTLETLMNWLNEDFKGPYELVHELAYQALELIKQARNWISV